MKSLRRIVLVLVLLAVGGGLYLGVTGSEAFQNMEMATKLQESLAKEKAEKQAKQAELEKQFPTLREELADKFYFSSLNNEEEEEAYMTLYLNSRAAVTTKDYYEMPRMSDLSTYRVHHSLSNDFPEFYWFGAGAYAMENNTPNLTDQQIEDYFTMLEMGKNIVSQLPQTNDFDKVKAIYDYVILHTEYNHAALADDALSFQNQAIDSVLLNGLSVCGGYSRTFQFLCQLAGIESIYVTGFLELGPEFEFVNTYHAWNLVKIDGKYYGVDTTWGDPAYMSNGQDENLPAINYDYLCIPATILERSHRPVSRLLEAYQMEISSKNDPDLTYPTYDDNSLNQHSLDGTYMEGQDMGKVVERLRQSLAAGQGSISLQFADKSLFDKVLQDVARSDSQISALYFDEFGSSSIGYSNDPYVYSIQLTKQ
ncbi:TPA: transglutaminase domain-containing protein [Streptococcus suis]